MNRTIKIVLGLLAVLIGIISYSALEDPQSLRSSVTDFVDAVNVARSSFQSESSSIGSPTEPISKLQQITLDDINQYRKANKLLPVEMINKEPSSDYAKLLLNERCLHHVQDDGITPQGRFHNAGIDFFAVSENLAGGQKVVFDNLENFIKKQNHEMMFNDAHSNWGHRDNILDPSHRAISIGIAYDATNMIIVEDFLTTLQSDEYIPSSAYHDIPDSKECW